MTTQVHPEKIAGLMIVVLFAMVAGGVNEASAMTALPEPVTVRTTREAQLYATSPPVLAIVRRGERVVFVAEKGKWSLVRYLPEDGEAVEGLVSAGALVRLGEKAEALRDTRLYAATRAVLATIPEGASVAVIGLIKGGYVVRYSTEDTGIREGVVAASAVPEIEELAAWRTQRAAIAQFELDYRAAQFSYARVGDRFVKLPTFDLTKVSSDPEGGAQLPKWKVGAFGHVPWVKVKEVFGPGRMLVTGRIYRKEAKTVGGGSVGTFNPGAADRLGPARVIVDVPVHCKILLTGWPTERAADRQMLWEDADAKEVMTWIAIIGTYTYRTPIGAKVTVLEAIPLAQVRRGLSRAEYRAMVEAANEPANLSTM